MINSIFCEVDKVCDLTQAELFGDKCLLVEDCSIVDTEQVLSYIIDKSDIKQLNIINVLECILPILPEEKYYKLLLQNLIANRDFIFQEKQHRDGIQNYKQFYFWNKPVKKDNNLSTLNKELKQFLHKTKTLNAIDVNIYQNFKQNVDAINILHYEHELIKEHFFNKINYFLCFAKIYVFKELYPDIVEQYIYKYNDKKGIIFNALNNYANLHTLNDYDNKINVNELLNIDIFTDKEFLYNNFIKLKISQKDIFEILQEIDKLVIHNLYQNYFLIKQFQQKQWQLVTPLNLQENFNYAKQIINDALLKFSKHHINDNNESLLDKLLNFFKRRKITPVETQNINNKNINSEHIFSNNLYSLNYYKKNK